MTSCHLSNPLRGTHRFLVNLFLLLFIAVSEVASSSGILDAYNIASFAQPEGEATSLTKFVVDSRTGSVYLAADKYLYRLALNLTVQESDIATGAECAGDDLCHDVAKILAIAAGDAGSLIICKSRDGLCEQRDLSRISQVLNPDEIGMVVVVPGDPMELTSAGVVAPGQDGTEALFVANTLSVNFPSIIHPVSRWYIEYSFLFDSGSVNFFALGDVNVNDFQIQYKDAFTYGGFVYYALNQEDRNGQYFSKLARVCPNVDDTFRSYTEITLHCGSADSSHYNLLQAVSVGAAGGALQQSLGLESASEKVLYATFSSSEPFGSSSSGESAICVFSMRDIEDSFLQAVRDCLTVTNAATTLYYLAGSTCNIYQGDELTDDIIRNILCSGSGDFPFTYANGIQDLVSTAAVQLPSDQVPTAVVSAVHRNHTVAFVGTQGGDLLKVHLMTGSSGRVYETISLGSSPVLSSMYNDRDAAILVATEQQLYRLAVANCEQYTSCGECIGVGGARDGDPYCGWCTLQARCTEYTECANPDQAGHWLAYDTAECIGINHLKPDSLPIGSSPLRLPTDVTFSINHLPVLDDDSTYTCQFNNIKVTTSIVGNNVTCPSPRADLLPAIQPGEDHVTMRLGVFADDSEIVSTDFFFYNCSAIKSCSMCTSSRWSCDWCLHDNYCTDESSPCEGGSTIAGETSPTVAAAKGPSFCPRLLAPDQPIYIPVGINRDIHLRAKNLPSNVNSYQCVLSVQGEKQVTPASVEGMELVCRPRQYTLRRDALMLEVPVSVRWNGANDIDGTSNNSEHDQVLVTLYNCAFERDSCSRCLSPTVTPSVLQCGWCRSTCIVENSPQCGGADWIPQRSNQSCPGPVVYSIMPSSGPVEGNTLVEIIGSDLGLTFHDIIRIQIGSVSCDPTGLESSYQVGTRVSCVTSGIRKEVEAAVSITIRDSLSNEVRSGGMVTFSYRDPSISSFSPSEGLANGGTLISIRGTSLHTGRNITASVGGSSCTVMPFNETLVQCVTSGASENSSGAVILKFDGAVRQSIQQFTYRSNPTIAVVQGLKSIASGGINITIRGEGFGIVQTALLIATLTAEPPVSSTVHCIPKGDDELVCPSPSLSANQSSRRRRSREVGRKRRRRSDVEEASLTLSLDGFEIDLPGTLAIYPDPVYDPFVGLRPIAADTALKLTGSYLDSAVTKSDVQVKIGPEDCKVLSIEADQLYCEPPLTQPAAGNELGVLGNGTFQQYPAVTVLHGSNLRFHLGYVNYSTGNSFSIIMVIVVAVLVVVAVIFILIAVSIYGRRVHQDKLKSAEDALIRLEVRLKDKATEAFHDLQRDMSGLKEQLEGVGMPFVSGADYIRNMLFWGLKVQPMTKDPELPQEHVRQAMLAFSKRLGEKEFLMSYIRELDDAKSLQQKDRVNIASLLTVILTTEGKFHYLTNVMLRLMEEKIEESDENRLKQLFRRTESIVEKLISNWIALCMYKHLQKEVAYPLYVLYQAIKGQCEKGPIDAITGQAHYSLNFDYLLDEDITFHEVTVQVVDKDHKVTEQVKVLDVDTITQAKQKILDAIYCKRQRSQQLRSYEVDLVLLNGQYGQVVLRDQDEMTDVRGIWVRSNTVRTYKISNGSSVAIVKKEEVSSPHLPGPLDKTELAFTYVPRFTESYSMWLSDKQAQYIRLNASEMPVPSSGRANHGRTSWEYTRIDMDVEEGKQLWHLVKEDSSVSKKKPKDQKVEHKPKLIKEVYTSRLLVTKNAVQHFLDEFLNATFSLGPDHTSLLAHIKFLFDFFDKQAEKHGNPKDNIATTWKNNSLPLRYWVTSISHPSFIFDMQQSLTADYCMNVLTNMLDNACRKIVPKYNLDASLNRILYRPELPKYIKMVESYYNAIADLPEISPAHLEETSQQVSKEFSSYFSRLGMLHQLYQFTKEHTEMLNEISAIIEERDD